jgi:predicted GNAT superfamily acetyltransferase
MIRIRSCAGTEELDACVRLQVETWGYDEHDVIPRKTFLLAQKIGGQVIGAFDSEAPRDGARQGQHLVGFAMSLPGIKSTQNGPKPYIHSHMLAVRDSHRNRGLGAQLKWEQRREALSRGIAHMEWTFDPLEIKNAFLNIHRLGAVTRTYLVDFYGVSSSRLQGGLPTDRLLAEWELDSPRVKAISGKGAAAAYRIDERIVVPFPTADWKASAASRNRALAVQLENRQKFQKAFSRGLAVLDFSRDAEGNGVFELGQYAPASPESDSNVVSEESKIL